MGFLSKAVEVARRSLSSEVDAIVRGAPSQMSMYGQAASSLPAPPVDGPAFNQSDFPPPGVPFAPYYNGVAPRTWDFGASQNLNRVPRAEDENSFALLHSLAKHNDVVQYCIRASTDELTAETGIWIPRRDEDKNNAEVKQLILEASRFWEKPNRMDNLWFDGWLTQILYDVFVTDALTIYPQRTVSGKVHSFVQVDGKTIKVLIDNFGRVPRPPYPAYQQVIHGIIRGDYTQDEMLYRPTNPQIDSPYGRSIVEMCLLHVVTGIRRWSFNLSYYTEGSIPQVFVQVPDVAPQAVKEWLELMNQTLGGDDAQRWKILPLPHDANVKEVRQPVWTKEQDEWIARVICALFSVAPTPFVSEMNRATAEVAEGIQTDMGLRPRKKSVASLITELEEMRSGNDAIQFVWPEDRTDMSEQRANVVKVFLDQGLMSREEVREEMLGLERDEAVSLLPLGPLVTAIGGAPEMPGTQAANDTPEALAPAEQETSAPAAAPAGPGAEITFNELTLAAERMKAFGDQDMVNAIRAVMAQRLGVPVPPPLTIASDVQEEIAVDQQVVDPSKVPPPATGAAPSPEKEAPAHGAFRKEALTEIAKWRKVIRKHGHQHEKALSFVCREIPRPQAERIRAAIGSAATPEEADAVLKGVVAEDAKRTDTYGRRERAMQIAYAHYIKDSITSIVSNLKPLPGRET